MTGVSHLRDIFWSPSNDIAQSIPLSLCQFNPIYHRAFYGLEYANLIIKALPKYDETVSWSTIDSEYIYPVLKKYDLYSPLLSLIIYNRELDMVLPDWLEPTQKRMLEHETSIWRELRKAHVRRSKV